MCKEVDQGVEKSNMSVGKCIREERGVMFVGKWIKE